MKGEKGRGREERGEREKNGKGDRKKGKEEGRRKGRGGKESHYVVH